MSLLLATGAGGSPVNYTLACASGSYAYTGRAATLSLKHSLLCATGTYTYTGTATTLSLRHSLVCAAGAYSYSGVAATLSVKHSLTCAAGAYAYTGNAATLNVVAGSTTYALTCAVGSYAYTGGATTLSYIATAPAPRQYYGSGRRSVNDDGESLAEVRSRYKKIDMLRKRKAEEEIIIHIITQAITQGLIR